MQSSLELEDKETASAHVSSIMGECGRDAEPVGVCRDPLSHSVNEAYVTWSPADWKLESGLYLCGGAKRGHKHEHVSTLL